MCKFHDAKIEQLYFDWLRVVSDPGAAAILTAAQLQSFDQPTRDAGLLNLKDAAAYLGYDSAGLRKIVKQRRIQFVQNGRGPIKFKREWLDAFVSANAGGPKDTKRSPVQRRTIPIRGTATHGFDSALFHADSHKGAA